MTSEQGNFDYSNYAFGHGLDRTVECLHDEMLKCEGWKWLHFDGKSLESHIQESAGTAALLLSLFMPVSISKLSIGTILQSADKGDRQLCRS